MGDPGLPKGCLVLLLILGAALAYENDDLVFDQDGKQSLGETPLIESRHHDSLLHRIKRGFFSFFAPATTTTAATTTSTEAASEANDRGGKEDADDVPIEVVEEKKPKGNVGASANLVRQTRESAEENEEAEEGNEIGNAAEARREPEKFGNTDDEDLAGSGDIEGSAISGIGPHNKFPGINNAQRRYYRITLTIGEPYLREYADRNSREYKELSGNLTHAFEELLNRHLPVDSHHANVVKISPTATDSFASLVTLDIGSTFTEEAEVRDIIEEQLQLHSLDNIQLHPEDFSFRIFQVNEKIPEEECDPSTEVTCRDGACVPLASRCDGIAQCEDASDELDCRATTTNPYTVTEEIDQEETTLKESKEEEEEEEEEEKLVEEEEEEAVTPRSATNKCRADDTVRCDDGSHVICSVQKCDGVLDCDDGGDEVGCNQTGCSAGEFACDVSRCILESERCNFVENCMDGSDEHDCNYPACTSTQFKCRNGQCIDFELHCNGARDCLDNSDERNCRCTDDQFECSPGYCVSASRLCDGTLDCTDGKDEANCSDTMHCREDEFQCGTGSCVSLSMRCDGRSDCDDRSDEHNCSVTTCSSDQFRCSDGTCVNINKRCDNVIDCRNAEDELQCGCGEGEFQCANGQCIAYVLQCTGIEDCADGSDERDCEKFSWRNVYNDVGMFMARFNISREQLAIITSAMKSDPEGRSGSINGGAPIGFYNARSKRSGNIGRRLLEKLEDFADQTTETISKRTVRRGRKGRRVTRATEGTPKKDSDVDDSTATDTEELSTPASIFGGDVRSAVAEGNMDMKKKKKRRRGKHRRRKHPKDDSDVDNSTATDTEEFSTPASIFGNAVKSIVAEESPVLEEKKKKRRRKGKHQRRKNPKNETDADNTTVVDTEELPTPSQILADASWSTVAEETTVSEGKKKKTGRRKHRKQKAGKNAKNANVVREEDSSTPEAIVQDATWAASSVAEEETETPEVEHLSRYIYRTAAMRYSASTEPSASTTGLYSSQFKVFSDGSLKENEIELEDGGGSTRNGLEIVGDEGERPSSSTQEWTSAEETTSVEPFEATTGEWFTDEGAEDLATVREDSTVQINTEEDVAIKTRLSRFSAERFEDDITRTTVEDISTESTDSRNNAKDNVKCRLLKKYLKIFLNESDEIFVELSRICPKDCDQYWKLLLQHKEIYSNLNGSGEAATFTTDEANYTPENPEESKEQADLWGASSNLSKTTVSPDLVEVFAGWSTRKPKSGHGGKKEHGNKARKKANRSSATVDNFSNRYPDWTSTASPKYLDPEERTISPMEEDSTSKQSAETPGSSTLGQNMSMTEFIVEPRGSSQVYLCGDDMFLCDDDLCVYNSMKCDRQQDCKDGTDEFDCHDFGNGDTNHRQRGDLPSCSEYQFPCDGRCINNVYVCDGHTDCRNGVDEADCGNEECPNGQKPCDNGVCINKDFFCDNNQDCLDNSDERNCPDPDGTDKHPQPVRCQQDEFSCRDGRTCIPLYTVCDGSFDCPDEDDEFNCPEGCGKDQFQCANGDCIRSDQKCDGYINCADGTDEEECDRPVPHPMPGRCPAGFIMCVTDKDCVPQSSICNGIPECRDRSDEENCEPPHSSSNLNLKTYPSEQVIKENPAKQGREVVFQCRDEGPVRARVRWLRGNNLPLPPGSTDVNGRLEIPNIQLDHAGSYICEAVGYPPSTSGQQISVYLRVEKLEQPITNKPHVCQYEEATCSNGECIPKSYVCNGRLDCTDGSDEMRCSPHGCEPNQYRCNNTECVSKVWRCDGDKDCADNSDEENCEPSKPGSPCRSTEYACSSGQCIPKTFQCDLEKDCMDGSDEIGCSPVYIIKPPPPMINLNQGEVLVITCIAIGVPTPEINWRLNWGHIPAKCTMTSVNGTGTLTCPDIQIEDQGAYSCEGLNSAGFVFAVQDAIVVVEKGDHICPKGMFNDGARSLDECISCFCFGVAQECRSANLYTYQIPPPLDRPRMVVADQALRQIVGDLENFDARNVGADSVQVYAELAGSPYRLDNNAAYFTMPEHYHGSQLKSYGGYLKYKIRYNGTGTPNSAPAVILMGNDYQLVHRGRQAIPYHDNEMSVRFFQGEWLKVQGYNEVHATREDIMMTLARVDNILIKAQYDDSPSLDVLINNIVMDTADARNTGLGSALYVEECQCPSGYGGLSCEQCAPGYLRRETGPWLGQCYRDEQACPPGYYGDPSRNIPCQVCPCPLTNPSNQFARTCHLGSDGQPTCDCPAGYVGRRCEQCDQGYQGNPLIPRDKCIPVQQCDPDGSHSPHADPQTGQCRCKQYVTGPTCNQCKANTFSLSSRNKFGCVSCFCMGITNKCVSSNWYRSDIQISFTNSIRNFSLVELKSPDVSITDAIRLNTGRSGEIIYRFRNSGNNDVYYWQLPNIFLGDQITSYGGNLKYTVRYVPAPGGQSSRNNAADVELISANDINLLYFSREFPEADTPHTFTVPLLEQYWQRTDGTEADREHLLMALADVRAIRFKATYTTHTDEAALSLVSLDTAEKHNTGKSRAVEVEECSCPEGYKGLSCENCDVGFTRTNGGLYLGICEACKCNGHSNQCDPDTGVCEYCAHHTTGASCEYCEPGYKGDATRGTPYDCTYSPVEPPPDDCNCNRAGSYSDYCIEERCECKRNVEGPECNRCRPGTFGLAEDNPEGCSQCYCSGITDQCHESSLYVQQIPVGVYNAQHGFTLTDSTRQEVIDEGFELNIALNEIGYRYSEGRGRRLFWSLPPILTGNKIKSYGGNLTLTQHITAYPGAQSYKDQDIILVGNGITLFWTNPVEIQPDVPLTYSAPLRESEWKRLTTEGPRVASRVDMMTVLSNLESILVRASHSDRMTATYISDISLDTAVDIPGGRRAVHVEVCRCPTGYTGTSCESCARGYYRDTNDRSTSYLGSCNLCPCNNHEESCEIARTGQVKCHCLPGYGGQYCQDTGELMVSLTPMTGTVKPNMWVLFTCSYESSDQLYIWFKLTPLRGYPLTAIPAIPGASMRTGKGGYRNWYVYVELEPCNVECYIQDRDGKDLIKVVTSIFTEHHRPTPIPPYPTISPPRIVVYIKGPEFQIVGTGTTVEYHCSGTSLDNERVDVRWEKEGGQLPPGRSVDDSRGLLIIREVKVSDSGIYVCQVSDGVHVAFKNVTLTVGGVNPVPPRAMILPPSLEVIEGEPAEFRCEANGNPPPQVEWTRVHGAMNPEVLTYNGIWSLRAVSKNDAAEYRCTARNNIGVDERTAILYVRSNPSKPPEEGIQPTITPSEWIGAVGEVVRITCTPSQVANITWSRQGNLPLPPSARQRSGVLTIMNPSLHDSGVYVCIATSHVGTETSRTVTITIQSRRTAPSVKVKPEKQTVPQGSIAEVSCLTSGEPGVQVRWSKYLELMSSRSQQIGDILRITNVQIADRGVYVCKVTGPSGSQEASAIIEVEPREAPLLELYPKETQAVILGGSADVQCRAIAGTPVPELHWSRSDGRPFAHNIKQLPGGVLRLTNITIGDSGGYVCNAVNPVGTTSAVAYIEVHTQPVITISPRSGILTVKRGDRVRLVCTATGNPQPSIEWTKHINGIVPYHKSIFEMKATPQSAVYDIQSVSHNDEGSYTCHAMNAAGIMEERVHIRIEDDNEVDPDPNGPIIVSENNFKIPNGGKVEMRCQVVSEVSHIYLDWKRSDHRPLPEGSMVHNGVLTIPAVDRSAAGEYVCLGMDQGGNVLFRAKSYLEVSSPPRIVLNPPRQTVGPGENPSIVCSATGDEPMTIEWSAIGRELPYSVSRDRGVLQFHGITYSDAGKYVCKASNEEATAEAVAEVLVNERSYEDTGVRASQRDVISYVGMPVHLRCTVQERATIQWSREGQPLPSNVRIEDDILEIPRARLEDSGRYICQIQTERGVSSDYINLNVSPDVLPDCMRQNQTHCGHRKCICNDRGCILLDYGCYIYVQYMDKHGENLNRRYLHHRRATVMPAVSVEVSQDPVNIGDTIDIRCACTGAQNPRYHWSRPNHPRLPANAQEYDSVLRLTSVTLAESGLYRCTAETQEGIFDQDFNLVVHGGHNDAPAIETRYAPYGSSIEMNCRPNADLEYPLSFHWSKLRGLLQSDAQIFESKLNLTNVRAEDAGTYICTVNNDHDSIEIPTVLVVTGVVPYFSQAPESYIALPPLRDAYLRFNIEVSFKPENRNGIILYESDDGVSDFIMLALVKGYPHFSFDLGSGQITIRADRPVTMSEWHTIKLQRNRKEGTMLVDGEGPYKGVADGRKQGLDIKTSLFVGGVPNNVALTKHATVTTGFVGCISRLVISERDVDLNDNQARGIGITNCETCAENPCNNGGVCQEAGTKIGYTCMCRAGYSGKHCDHVGQSCYPGACGEGKCVENETGFDCYCPHGKTGSRCENLMNIHDPAFHDDKSFVAHDTPKAFRRTRMSTTHSRYSSRRAQVRPARSRPHHHNNPHHTNH
ncbi:terribly reduced optic lobes isoform X1 [Megalopta genalis]|uniref:terribly reduced optic lobes isoform X1 n=1 Tax=Megalopta genalis TaxID=115081 RepID=UPI003FCF03E5